MRKLDAATTPSLSPCAGPVKRGTSADLHGQEQALQARQHHPSQQGASTGQCISAQLALEIADSQRPASWIRASHTPPMHTAEVSYQGCCSLSWGRGHLDTGGLLGGALQRVVVGARAALGAVLARQRAQEPGQPLPHLCAQPE